MQVGAARSCECPAVGHYEDCRLGVVFVQGLCRRVAQVRQGGVRLWSTDAPPSAPTSQDTPRPNALLRSHTLSYFAQRAIVAPFRPILASPGHAPRHPSNSPHPQPPTERSTPDRSPSLLPSPRLWSLCANPKLVRGATPCAGGVGVSPVCETARSRLREN